MEYKFPTQVIKKKYLVHRLDFFDHLLFPMTNPHDLKIEYKPPTQVIKKKYLVHRLDFFDHLLFPMTNPHDLKNGVQVSTHDTRPSEKIEVMILDPKKCVIDRPSFHRPTIIASTDRHVIDRPSFVPRPSKNHRMDTKNLQVNAANSSC